MLFENIYTGRQTRLIRKVCIDNIFIIYSVDHLYSNERYWIEINMNFKYWVGHLIDSCGSSFLVVSSGWNLLCDIAHMSFISQFIEF